MSFKITETPSNTNHIDMTPEEMRSGFQTDLYFDACQSKAIDHLRQDETIREIWQGHKGKKTWFGPYSINPLPLQATLANPKNVKKTGAINILNRPSGNLHKTPEQLPTQAINPKALLKHSDVLFKCFQLEKEEEKPTLQGIGEPEQKSLWNKFCNWFTKLWIVSFFFED
jgi:hypothetical protein